ARMVPWVVFAVPPHDDPRPGGGDLVRAVRSVAAHAAALVPAMDASGRRRRRLDADHDTGRLPAGDSRRRAAVLGEPGPVRWVDAPDLPRAPDRAVDDARGGRPAEGGVRAQSDARVRARAQRTRAAGARRATASAPGAGRAALPVQYAGERAGARRRGVAACLAGASAPPPTPSPRR